ncbi:MAG: DNA polymerase III subunit gamma/tau [Acidimicrobiales bacterium]
MADALDDIPYQSLYRRFRPSTFAEVRGQDHVVLALRNAVRDQRVAHAYLFSGPRGTGKTSTARILAKALNCTDLRDGEPCGGCTSCVEIARGTSLDVHELDAASNNGVEAMRDLVSRAALGTPGRQKVYIVDEVHMLSTAASNALLKTLEEPPAHVVFVLATTDPQKVLPTIRSRTQHFEFRLLGPEILGELLDQVRREAQLDVPDEALDLAVRRGRGSARDALSVLDQVAASDAIDDDQPELGEIVDALAEQDIARALVAVAQLTSAGFSPQQLAGDLVDNLRQGFLALVAPDLVAVSGSERNVLAARAEGVGLAALVRAMEVLGRAQVTMRDAPDPRVNLEVALVRLAHPAADDSPEAMLGRIERLEAGAGVPTTTSVPAPPPPRVAAEPPPMPSPTPGAPRKTLGAVRRQAGVGATGPEPAPSTPASPPPEPTGPEPAPTTPASPPPAPTAPVAADRAPAPDPSPTGDAIPFPTRDDLVQAWGDHILGRLRPKAKALFQAGRFVGVDGDRAVYGLPNEIHRARCEEVRGDIEAALGEHFGRPVGMVLVVDAGAAGVPTDDSHRPTGDGEPVGPGRNGGVAPDAPTATPTGRRPSPDEDRAPDATAPASTLAERATTPVADDLVDDVDDPSVFEEARLGEVADVDNSAQARVLQAFPGAEEVS